MKLSTIKDIVIITAIGFLLYDKWASKPTLPQTVTSIIRDTVRTQTIVTVPKPGKKVVLVKRDTIYQEIVNIPHFDTTELVTEYQLFNDTVDIEPGAKLYASHIAKDMAQSSYTMDLVRDTVVKERVSYTSRPCITLYGTTQVTNTGASAGVAIGGRKLMAGYSYDFIQRSHQVTIGMRIAGF